jgi:hypothetical protein
MPTSRALVETEEPKISSQSVCVVGMFSRNGSHARFAGNGSCQHYSAPKRADVVGWCDPIADHAAHGSGAERVRRYLKAVSKAGWDDILIGRLQGNNVLLENWVGA